MLRYIRRFRRRKRCEGVVCWAEKLRVYAGRETEGEWGRLKTLDLAMTWRTFAILATQTSLEKELIAA
jgi:hypothetical protein